MILKANGENGVDGATVIAGNEWDIVASVNAPATTYDHANAIVGQLSYLSISATSGQQGGYVGWSTSLSGPLNELWFRMYAMVPTSYSGSLINARTGGTAAAKFIVKSTGLLAIQDVNSVEVGTSTSTITLGSPFRIEAHIIGSSSPTGSTLELRYFSNANIDGTTPTEVIGPITGVQTAATFSQVWYGPIAAGGGGKSLYHDNDAVSDVGWIGPELIPIAWYYT